MGELHAVSVPGVSEGRIPSLGQLTPAAITGLCIFSHLNRAQPNFQWNKVPSTSPGMQVQFIKALPWEEPVSMRGFLQINPAGGSPTCPALGRLSQTPAPSWI